LPDEKFIDEWQAGGRLIVISLRNLEPVYDIGTLLDAVPTVCREVPNVLFVICGTGSSEAALKKRVNDLGIGQSVRFTGRYDHDELHNMLRSSDVYVSTSLSDGGIAASTAEAMACGLPAVVTNTGENDQWIEDGKTGFLVAARTPSALANRIVYLLRDSALRKAIGLAARNVIVERNDYTTEMSKMERLYEEIASRQVK
jgi:glycosyltransferase involved in cell wall biosynthesis